MSSLTEFFNELSKHTNALAVAVGVAVVIGFIGVYVNSRQDAKSDTAKDSLYLANQMIEKKLTALAEAAKPAAPETAKDKAPAKPAPANSNMVAYKRLDVDTELADGVRALKNVAEKFSGTRAAFDARLQLGDLYYRHGQADKAVPLYQKAVETSPGPFQKGLALSSLGYALENSGKLSEAVQTFEKAIGLGEASLKGDLLLAVARCQEGLHDTAKARSTYDQIVSQLPNTEYSRSAQTLKAKLQ